MTTELTFEFSFPKKGVTDEITVELTFEFSFPKRGVTHQELLTAHCNTLQHTATHDNKQQHTAKRGMTCQVITVLNFSKKPQAGVWLVLEVHIDIIGLFW